MTSWTMPDRVTEHPMYHLGGGNWFEDSPRGIARAAALGFVSTDLNMQPQRPDPNCPLWHPGAACEGHDWDAHWKRPLMHGWVDPEGKMRRWKPYWRMTTAEIQRIHPKGHPNVHPELMETQIARLARHGLHGSLEAKGRWHWTRARMRRLWDACHRYEVPALVKSAWTLPLRRARAVGFQTRYTRDHRRGM
jgi:hypothetical protein